MTFEEEDAERQQRTMADFYPDWHKRSLCYGHPIEDFFGATDTTERPALSMSTVTAAQEICDACPVRQECLTDALEVRNEYGIWGGTSGRTRRRIWEAIDAGETTVEEVVAAYLEGDGDRWNRATSPEVLRRSA